MQRRNRSLSKALGAKLLEIDISRNIVVRYTLSAYKSCSEIINFNPKLIFVQNPSIILAALAVLTGFISNKKIIIDAHNAGLCPRDGKSMILNFLTMMIIRHSDLVIVSNGQLGEKVEKMGGKYVVLPDPIPEFSLDKIEPIKLDGSVNILFICSWADDEPYTQIIDSAKLISPDTFIYITGNWRKKLKELPEILPDNVVLTGFVSEEEFLSLLASVDFIIDLTTREDCLVCGAYEGLAMEKPLLLSDTETNRSYFNKATVYTDCAPKNIAGAINLVKMNIPRLREESSQLKVELKSNWERNRKDLERNLAKL